MGFTESRLSDSNVTSSEAKKNPVIYNKEGKKRKTIDKVMAIPAANRSMPVPTPNKVILDKTVDAAMKIPTVKGMPSPSMSKTINVDKVLTIQTRVNLGEQGDCEDQKQIQNKAEVCSVCDIFVGLPGSVAMNLHVKGKQHLAKIKEFQRNPMSHPMSHQIAQKMMEQIVPLINPATPACLYSVLQRSVIQMLQTNLHWNQALQPTTTSFNHLQGSTANYTSTMSSLTHQMAQQLLEQVIPFANPATPTDLYIDIYKILQQNVNQMLQQNPSAPHFGSPQGILGHDIHAPDGSLFLPSHPGMSPQVRAVICKSYPKNCPYKKKLALQLAGGSPQDRKKKKKAEKERKKKVDLVLRVFNLKTGTKNSL